MTPNELERKLNELEQHLARAGTAERRNAAPRLQRLLSRTEDGRAMRPARRRDHDDEVDLFDNMPV